MKLYFAILVAFVVVSGCKPDQRSGTVRVALPGQPANLDTNKAYDAIAGIILMQTSEGLTRHDEELNVLPALAQWEFGDDYRTITYTIREDARWSDGEPVLASHFRDSWLRLLRPSTAAEYAYFLWDIEKGEAFNSGNANESDVGIEVVDDRTLRVRLRQPAPYFPHITTFMVTHPIRKEIVEAHPQSWTEPEHAVVTGAFRPVEHMHEYRIALEPNPHWALGEPDIERLELYMTAEKATGLNLFMTGHMDVVIDLLPIAIPEFRGRAGYVNAPKLETRYVGIRVDEPPLDDVRVRRALALATRRDSFPNVLKGGEIPTNSWLPPGMFGHSPDVGIAHDPEAARELLAEAGYPGGEGFPEFTLLFRAGDDWRLIAENLQEQWKSELGITVRIQTREQKVFFQEIDGEAPPPAHLARWIADFPDPENWMSLFESNSGNNSLGFASQRYDELVDAAVETDDPAERKRLYDKAQEILVVEEVAMIPIYVAAQNVLVSPRLKGVTFNAMGDVKFGYVEISDDESGNGEAGSGEADDDQIKGASE